MLDIHEDHEWPLGPGPLNVYLGLNAHFGIPLGPKVPRSIKTSTFSDLTGKVFQDFFFFFL